MLIAYKPENGKKKYIIVMLFVDTIMLCGLGPSLGSTLEFVFSTSSHSPLQSIIGSSFIQVLKCIKGASHAVLILSQILRSIC